MRILASLNGNQILQVLPDPEVGDAIDVTGRFVVDLPADISVDTGSSLSTVVSDSFAKWLSTEGFPYSNVQEFAVLAAADINSYIDPAETVDNGANEVLAAPYTGTIAYRGQTGRHTVSPTGNSVASLAMLSANDATVPEKPGCLVTTRLFAFDASIFTTIKYYWNVYQMGWSHDVRSSYGATADTNTPALKTLTYPDQELSDLVVAASYDDGTTWEPISRGVATDLSGVVDPDVRIKLAFFNTGSSNLYLGSFGMIY